VVPQLRPQHQRMGEIGGVGTHSSSTHSSSTHSSSSSSSGAAVAVVVCHTHSSRMQCRSHQQGSSSGRVGSRWARLGPASICRRVRTVQHGCCRGLACPLWHPLAPCSRHGHLGHRVLAMAWVSSSCSSMSSRHYSRAAPIG
jgi:hypothetical protein